MTNGPILIELDGKEKPPTPDDAPPVPEPELVADLPEGQAMQAVATLTARPPSRLARWFWGLLVTLVGIGVSVAAWDFATGLLTRFPPLGYAVTGLLGLFVLVLVVIGLRELAGFARLRRIDQLHHAADEALTANDLAAARRVTDRLMALYRGRDDTRWGREKFAERAPEQFDADGLFALAEDSVLVPLDKAASAEVEAAARQVAMVTALVPLAFADVLAALTANIRMVRRIAEVYGGRSGTLGSFRLLRAVFTHLIATGAVAVGDDLIGSFAGGGLLSKVSRRFGEGFINGALTARVGVAAMEVCRPLPFSKKHKPSLSGIVKRSLTGLFGTSKPKDMEA